MAHVVREAVLNALEQSRGKFISGGELAERFGVSRTAIWKVIAKFREEGMQIDTVHGSGYCLRMDDDSVTKPAILRHLQTEQLGRELVVLPSVASTNTLIKQEYYDKPHGFTLVAREQTAGRGRLGRTFCSPDGGLYFSVLLRLPFSLAHINRITLAASVAVCQAIENLCGIQPGIKWVNDIFMNGKKLCGILTEASVEGESGAVDFVVLGIGLNVRLMNDLPPEIQDIAGALAQYCTPPLRAVLVAEILKQLEKTILLLEDDHFLELLQAYRQRLCMLGQTVQVIGDGQPYFAQAEDIDANGYLIIRREDGTKKALYSGEISIRPQNV